MAGQLKHPRHYRSATIDSHGRTRGDFLPDLCNVLAVFHLVLAGELLAIALALFDSGLFNFNWHRLGVLSMLIQWVVLTSAACLCPLRPWFRRQPPMLAGTVSYSLVMAVTVLYSVLGVWVQSTGGGIDWDLLFTNLLLAAVFAGIVLRYFYLQQQLRNQQQAELTARIQALQSRIRPHFLFNSMNSIASLIDIDPEAAERMVVDLADLFRASLSEPGLIPLEKELELCRRFVGIEQIRIGDRLQMQWRIDAPEGVLIPSLLLQPLIENAIYHGVQPLPEGGTVVVDVRMDGTTCVVQVTNPLGDNKQSTGRGNGLALQNIAHRLEAHYGKKGALLVNADASSYSVSVRFPAKPPVITS